eukprot:TRINITY_DN19501_c0_g1::TRINITY_DN19501_c0_g1_i1::g.17111::m.17111 TRINITY_DN19501_c0_g1::TRINITY_DN19501_c0_g1_i1::g.17111  ORF type:complete len:115 (-),score=-0.84,PLDc/PF00614.17/3.1e+03,PLDc/PF00614.17/0.22 TRINITY_DN19501_c0_g1_i1:650-994(-)
MMMRWFWINDHRCHYVDFFYHLKMMMIDEDAWVSDMKSERLHWWMIEMELLLMNGMIMVEMAEGFLFSALLELSSLASPYSLPCCRDYCDPGSHSQLKYHVMRVVVKSDEKSRA